VTPSYQERVNQIIDVLKSTTQTEDAWRKLCNIFNLRA